jgi:hypothetical protein
MILLYTLLVALLGSAAFVLRRRANRLEGQYTKAAEAVERLLREDGLKPGNSNKPDLCRSARRHYLLGQLVEKRDRVEQKYLAWQHAADRYARRVERVRAWKGRKLPYSLGVLDVSSALWVVDHLGVGRYVSADRLVQLVTALING